MEVLGYIFAVFIGVSLGLIGGGGSILTVPVLVYLMHIEPVMATSYSLFIVGATSLIGAGRFAKKQLLNYKTALVFGIPSILAVYATRKFLMPAIPEHLFSVGSLNVSKDVGIMVLFAILMVLAAYSMIRKNKKEVLEEEKLQTQKFNYPLIIVEGIVVGTLTGLVGAGGGFLIIPALVLLTKLPMKMAVGTSLLIIAAKSLIGFTGDLQNFQMDWVLMGAFTGLSIFGIFIGTYTSRFVSGEKLKPAFGWFVLVMGIYIIGKELIM